MGGNWKEYNITELYKISSGLSKPAKDFGEGFPFLAFKDVFYNWFLPKELTNLVKSNDKERNACSIKRGDVFLTRTSETMDELGMSSIARKDYPNATFNGFCKRLRPFTNIPIYPEYIGYFLRSPQFRNRLSAFSTMSTRASLNNGMIGSLKIILPPFPEQKRIARILGSLDDKIELNRQMNATLEGMAQALFKSWFVDFDPVIDNALAAGNPIPEAFAARAETRRKALADGTANRDVAKQFPAAFQFTEEMGWIPEGWEMAKLSELLEVKYGKAHKNLSEGHIPVYGSGGLMRHADKSLYEGESVLIPRKGTLSNILYLNEEFWTVDTMFYTIPKIKFTPKYIFYHLKALDFESMNVGSAVPSMTTKVLNELLILMPEKMMLQNFDVILNSYFLKIRANNTQSKTLSNLRDTLLPKLISGEIRIPEAEKLTEEALA